MALSTSRIAVVRNWAIRETHGHHMLGISRGAAVSIERRNQVTLCRATPSVAVFQKNSTATKARFSSTNETSERLTSLTPYQLMQKIKGVEAVPSFSQRRIGNASEQKWFNQYLDKEITEEQLIEKVNKLEEKNKLAKPQALLFTNEQAISATEKWIKECIVGMNLCPYASAFEGRQTLHVAQTLGLFVPSEYVTLHAQHLVVEREVSVKLIIFPNRGNYIAFQEMFQFMTQTESLRIMLEEGHIKMDMFHPKAENPLYLEDDPRQFIRRSPFATIQLTRGREQKKVIKDWERKYHQLESTNGIFKKINKITEDNNTKFSKMSAQKLEFLFENLMPEKVIICHDKVSPEIGDHQKSDTIDIPK